MKKEDAFYMCPLFCLQRRKGEKVKIWLRLARFLIRQLIDCSTYQFVNFSTH